MPDNGDVEQDPSLDNSQTRRRSARLKSTANESTSSSSSGLGPLNQTSTDSKMMVSAKRKPALKVNSKRKWVSEAPAPVSARSRYSMLTPKEVGQLNNPAKKRKLSDLSASTTFGLDLPDPPYVSGSQIQPFEPRASSSIIAPDRALSELSAPDYSNSGTSNATTSLAPSLRCPFPASSDDQTRTKKPKKTVRFADVDGDCEMGDVQRKNDHMECDGDDPTQSQETKVNLRRHKNGAPEDEETHDNFSNNKTSLESEPSLFALVATIAIAVNICSFRLSGLVPDHSHSSQKHNGGQASMSLLSSISLEKLDPAGEKNQNRSNSLEPMVQPVENASEISRNDSSILGNAVDQNQPGDKRHFLSPAEIRQHQVCRERIEGATRNAFQVLLGATDADFSMQNIGYKKVRMINIEVEEDEVMSEEKMDEVGGEGEEEGERNGNESNGQDNQGGKDGGECSMQEEVGNEDDGQERLEEQDDDETPKVNPRVIKACGKWWTAFRSDHHGTGRCSECGRWFSNAKRYTFIRHLKEEAGLRFACSKCSREWSRIEQARQCPCAKQRNRKAKNS